jgi:hypothetical protein
LIPCRTRRDFLLQSLGGVSSLWLTANWPALLSAAEHARKSTKFPEPAGIQFFSPEQAAEVDAISSRIIPATDTPGAHEAGVVYFIDRALVTFAKPNQQAYVDGLAGIQTRISEMFPGTKKFSAATAEQQDKLLHALDEESQAPAASGRRSLSSTAAGSFFEVIRVHTVMGFLIDPDSDRRGNHDAVGWKAIGRDPSHMFQPPFGFYDKDYPGWQPNPADAAKTSS